MTFPYVRPYNIHPASGALPRGSCQYCDNCSSICQTDKTEAECAQLAAAGYSPDCPTATSYVWTINGDCGGAGISCGNV